MNRNQDIEVGTIVINNKTNETWIVEKISLEYNYFAKKWQANISLKSNGNLESIKAYASQK